MSELTPRATQILKLLEKQPNDPFLLYGLAMEHKKAGDAAAAVECFDRTLAADPLYCYAYYQKAQVLQSTGDVDGARRVYRDGIDAATRKGDAHAREEIAAALSMIE